MKKIKICLFCLGLYFLISFDCNTKMSKSELLVKQGVFAVMPPDFEYDFKFKVLSYDWIFKTKNDAYTGSSKSSLYPEELVKCIKAGNPNDILFIENVKVIGDDKLVRKISGLTIVLK
jgi:hypothetical protein